MGASFDRWLARPSTLCFLRRVIRAETTCETSGRRQWPARRRQSTAIMVQDNEEREDEIDTAPDDPFRPPPCGKRIHQKLYKYERIGNSKRALYMSLRSGASLLPADVRVENVVSELEFQTDVGSLERLGRLEIDRPENISNMKLWVEILDTRIRLHGRLGLEAVWSGLRSRGVDLPVEGEGADALWQAFIHGFIRIRGNDASIRDETLLLELFQYAQDLDQRKGLRYTLLYKEIVGRLLRIAPRGARSWHARLVDAGFAQHGCFVQVIPDLMNEDDPAMKLHQLKFFRQRYRDARASGLYDSVIAQAMRLPTAFTALKLHQFLLKLHDRPSETFFHDPGVQRLFRLDEDRSQSSSTTLQQPKLFWGDSSATSQPTVVNREAMNTIVGDVHGIKPKELTDPFCARMFATRAFSVDWVIRGLALFGVDKLGPLAMREMAVRSGSAAEFRRDLQRLADAEIGTGDATFCRLLVRVSKEDNTALWQSLLESDQHHEAYDDAHTQAALLADRLERRLPVETHLSLIIAHLSGSRASAHAWNCVLQHYLLAEDYSAVVNTLALLQTQEVFLTSRTLDLLARHVLPRRDVSKRPYKGRGPGIFEPNAFVAKAYIYGAQKGTHPRHRQWTEILKRLGMTHDWKQFARVVPALLSNWRHRDGDRMTALEEKLLHAERLQAVFAPNMCKAVFIWGFRSASVRNQLQLCAPDPSEEGGESDMDEDSVFTTQALVEKWAQGLPLLQHMRSAGVDVNVDDIRIAFVQRMWILFGPGFSTRAINHEARRVNRLSLAHYIKHANEVWEGLVGWVDPALLERENDPRLLPAFFGEVRLSSIRRNELVDVRKWSEALASGEAFVVEPKTTLQKGATWRRSSLRLAYRPMQGSDPLLASEVAAAAARAAGIPVTQHQSSRSPRRTERQVRM